MGREIADLVGGVGGGLGGRDCRFSEGGAVERNCRFSGRQWGRVIADLVGGGVGERLQILWEAVGERNCRFSGRWCEREIADLVGRVGESDWRFSGSE